MAHRSWIFVPVLLGISLLASGCTREMYRKSADEEVYCAVSEKSNDPRWNLQNYTIDVDPRSRFYNGFDPDHEPLPPDDPAAHEFMHEVNCMQGDPRWHCNGDTPFTENPEWMAFLPRDEQGRIQVDLNNSVRIGLLHSREYQRELEDLYLSALDVTFERFRFDVQFFATNDTFFTADGPIRPGSGATGQSSSRLTNDLNVSAQKLSATGGQYMVELANSLVWQFSGPDTHAATTLLDFSLVQPLLRGGARARVLERLTLAERVLLGNVRLMDRYRSGFYIQVTTGRDPGAGPARRGGAFGGAGLSGFTGLAGGFGRVANTNNAGGAGASGAAGGAGAGQAGGFLGLIQTQQQLRNQEANVAALSDSLAQLQAAYDAGRIDRFQVDFGRQALYNARSQLLTSKTTFQNSQDTFKLVLGLPPHLEFKIDDPLLEPFQLIDPAIPTLQNQLTGIQESLGSSIVNLRDTLDRNNQANNAATVALELAQLRSTIATAGRVQTDSLRHIAKVKLDVDEILSSLPQRRETYEILKSRGISAQSRTAEDVPTTAANTPDNATDEKTTTDDPGSEAGRVEAAKLAANQPTNTDQPKNENEFDRMLRDLEKLPRELTESLRALVVKIQQYPAHFQAVDAELAALQNTPQDLAAPNGRLRLNKTLEKIPDLLVELSSDVLELSLIQARAKAESVTLLPLQLQACDALAIASKNRRDWMNARASLVDTWRLIEFNANDLLSTFNVVLGGDISTVGDNPVDFRSATGRLRVGMQFDAPLTRVAERNNYRQALIEYQQARRDYYAFVDRISQVLRTSVRQVELDQANFELRRAAVRVAIDQVEVSRLKLREPPKPGVETTASNPTIARDLVSSLADLLNVQNDFMSVWVNFEVERMNLDFNMDTMQIDGEGLWVDPGKNIGMNGLAELQSHPGDEEQWDRAVHEGREMIPTPEANEKLPPRGNPRQQRDRDQIQQTTFESEEEIDEFVKPRYQTIRSQNTRAMNSQNRTVPQAKPANQPRPTQPRAGSVAAPRAGSVESISR